MKYLLSVFHKKESLSSSDTNTLFLVKSLFNTQNWQGFIKENSEHRKIIDDVHLSFQSFQLNQSYLNPENCAVCELPVLISEFRNGICPNGHSWHRCSQCFNCIFSFSYLECIGCHAKACNEDSYGPLFCLICGCKFRRIGVAFS